MKKGFTLIELLAVIVVLAVILVILMPIIGNVISDGEEGAFKTNVSEVMKLVKIHYQENYGGNLSNNPIIYNISENKIIHNSVDIGLTSNTNDLFGTIEVNSNGELQVEVKDTTYCATKEFDGNLTIHNLNDDSECSI